MLTYIILVVLLFMSSLEFADEEVHRDKFSDLYPELHDNFTDYCSNENFKYRFEVDDFYIRRNNPSNLDIILCIWLFGNSIMF